MSLRAEPAWVEASLKASSGFRVGHGLRRIGVPLWLRFQPYAGLQPGGAGLVAFRDRSFRSATSPGATETHFAIELGTQSPCEQRFAASRAQPRMPATPFREASTHASPARSDTR